jgi:hypothetical protein
VKFSVEGWAGIAVFWLRRSGENEDDTKVEAGWLGYSGLRL